MITIVSAVPSDLCCFFCVWIVAIASNVIVLAWLKDTESQKIGNLPFLATCWSGTLAILSSEGDVPVSQEALGNA